LAASCDTKSGNLKKLTYVENCQISTDWTILNAFMINMRLEIFLVFGLRARKIDKVRFLAFVTIFDRPLQEK